MTLSINIVKFTWNSNFQLRVHKKGMSGLPYLRKLSLDDFKISVILSLRVLKYGNISQKSWELNTRTFLFQASCESRSIYYPTPSPVFQCVSLVLAPSGKPDSSVKIACLARLPPPPLPQQHLARACKCWLAWENFGVKCPQPRGINLGKNTCA